MHSRFLFVFFAIFRGYSGLSFCGLFLSFLCLFAAILLCGFVPLREILFASIRGSYSRGFAVCFCAFCAFLRLFLALHLRKSAFICG